MSRCMVLAAALFDRQRTPTRVVRGDGFIDEIGAITPGQRERAELELRAMIDHGLALAEVGVAPPADVQPVFVAWDMMQDGDRDRIAVVLAEVRPEFWDRGTYPRTEKLAWTLGEVGRRATRRPRSVLA